MITSAGIMTCNFDGATSTNCWTGAAVAFEGVRPWDFAAAKAFLIVSSVFSLPPIISVIFGCM